MPKHKSYWLTNAISGNLSGEKEFSIRINYKLGKYYMKNESIAGKKDKGKVLPSGTLPRLRHHTL